MGQLASPAVRGALSAFGLLHFFTAAGWLEMAGEGVIVGPVSTVAVDRVAALLDRHRERLLARCSRPASRPTR
jgi:hypothetical protein